MQPPLGRLTRALSAPLAREAIDWEQEGLLDGLDGDDRKARCELLRQLADDGVTLEELRQAIAEERLALLPVERVLGAGQRRHSVENIASRSGLSPQVLVAFRRAAGLPVPSDLHGTDEDLEGAQTVSRWLDAGVPEEGMLELTRVIGEVASRLAAATRSVLGNAFMRPGDSELDLGLRYARVARAAESDLERLLMLAVRAHQREQLASEVVDRSALAAGRLPGSRRVAVGFADVVDFTRVSEGLMVGEVGALAGRLDALAREALTPPTVLVKTIGDAVMLVSPEPAALVETALALTGAVDDDADLPPLRAGLAYGEALTREGDWFGQPVNVASRLTALADPGCLLATPALRDVSAGPFEWHGPLRRRIKGVGTRSLFEVRSAPDLAKQVEPWPGYDEQTAREITRLVRVATRHRARRVLEHERAGKRRVTVLRAAERICGV